MIVGVVAPVLLLPEGFSEHGRQEMRAALLHELAHVKRRDYLVNALCQMVALPVVWHPVTHWVQGRVRRTREMVCDAMAAEEMQSEIGYARCLLTLAKSMLAGQELDGHAAGAGLFSHNVLEERVMQLMETKAAMRVRTKVVRVASGATAMVAATAMAMMFHVTPTMAASNATAAAPQSETAAVQTQPASTGVANPDAAAAQETQSQQEKKHVGETTNTYVRSGKHCDGKTYAIVNGVRRPLTAEEKAKLDEALARAQAKIAAAQVKIDSPEFRRQIEDAQRKAVEAEAKISSPEFQQRIADAQKKAEEAEAKIDSPEFRKQIEDAQKVTENLKVELPQIQLNIREAIAQINSPEFRKQIKEAQKVNIAEVQRQIDEATRQLNDTIDMNIKVK
jgi:BlaR1 peptidase M56